MAMVGDDLKAQLKAAILAEVQALFPPPDGLSPEELALIEEGQEKFAQAVGYGDGPTTVSYIQDEAEVDPDTLAVVPANMSAGGDPVTGNGAVSVGKGKVL